MSYLSTKIDRTSTQLYGIKQNYFLWLFKNWNAELKSLPSYPLLHIIRYIWSAKDPIGVEVLVLVAASWLSPRSLSIKDEPKPPLYSLEDGTLGITPGTGL